jgi:hypothetical protein
MVNSLQTALLAVIASGFVLALPNSIPSLGLNSDPLLATTRIKRRGLTIDGRATQLTYENEAVVGIEAMEKWYGSNGLWNNEWWNSANVITMLADFQEFSPGQVSGYTSGVFPYTFNNAPSWGGFTGFINQYYDDELWWCLAWIKVFDVTGTQMYLDMASSIFEDAKKAWGTPTCGGLM